MKKIALSLVLLTTCLYSQEALLLNFMQETNEALPIPSAQSIAATAALLGGTTIGGVTAFQKVTTSLNPQTRSVPAGLTSTLFSSPLIWSAVGASAMAFIVYYFIGEEMGIIIETKGTLKALTKQIELWQHDLPLLKENQENIAKKVKDAVGVLDTITPLVTKLAKNSETVGAAQQVATLQKELASLKATVESLATAQGTATGKAIEKKSNSIFGFGKRKSTFRPL